jgi:hypothetical protein
MTSELISDRPIGTVGSLKRSTMLLHCSDDGKNVQSGDVMSCSVDSPLRTSR